MERKPKRIIANPKQKLLPTINLKIEIKVTRANQVLPKPKLKTPFPKFLFKIQNRRKKPIEITG